MKIALLLIVSGCLCACDDPPAPAASASAASTAKPTPPKPSAAPTAAPTATTDASAAAPVLPGTSLKDALKDADTIMALGKASGPMGVMASDKKDIAAILAAIGTDQTLSKAFTSRCNTPTRLAFQDKDRKQLGVLGFCDTDDKLVNGRFDGPGAVDVAVDTKDPAALKASLKKIGALK